jgi:hypothetical protein
MKRVPVATLGLTPLLSWLSLIVLIAMLSLTMSGLVAHVAGATATPESVRMQNDERESFTEKRHLAEDANSAHYSSAKSYGIKP